MEKENKKNKYGQYMTPEIVSDFMVSMITKDSSAKILEPSCGNGTFINSLKKCGFKNIYAYEIDRKLAKECNHNVINESYISSPDKESYDVIIGNPPYIRWKNLEDELKIELINYDLWNKYCNALCDYSTIFMAKAVRQLKENGELIFITPEYWLKTTHSSKLRDLMLDCGYIDEIYHFNETPIFKDVTVSLIIFKYIKSIYKKDYVNITLYNSKRKLDQNDLVNIKNKNIDYVKNFSINQFEKGKVWSLINTEECVKLDEYESSCHGIVFGNKCRIGNGMVSGLDKAFQISNFECLNDNEKNSTIDVLKAKNISSFSYGDLIKYIFIQDKMNENEFKNNFPNFYEMLQPYKEKLLKRYNYGKDIKYWEWSFLRNYENLFKNQSCKIMVPCKERITNKNKFRFAFVKENVYPTQDVTSIYLNNDVKESIYYILAMLNSNEVFNWVSNRGVRKGDIVEFCEKPISKIPFRCIDFSNSYEIEIHDIISIKVRELLLNGDIKLIDEIQNEFSKLIKK